MAQGHNVMWITPLLGPRATNFGTKFKEFEEFEKFEEFEANLAIQIFIFNFGPKFKEFEVWAQQVQTSLNFWGPNFKLFKLGPELWNEV